MIVPRTRRVALRIYQATSGLLVLALCALLLFPSPYMVWGFAGALAFFLLGWLAQEKPFPASPGNRFLLIFLVMVGVGLAISSVPSSGIRTAGQVVAGVTLFYWLGNRIDSIPRLRESAALLVGFGVLLTLAAPLTVSFPSFKVFELPAQYAHLWPKISKVTNPNVLAGGLAPIVPFAIALAMSNWRGLRILGALGLSALVLMLLQLQSRGALVALSAGLALYLTLHRRWALPLIPLALLLGLYVNAFTGASSQLGFLVGNSAAQIPASMSGRETIWLDALHLIASSPLWGIGLGAWSHVVSLQPGNTLSGPSLDHAHNLLLQVALDTGIPGLAAFLALFALALYSAWHAYSARFQVPLAIAVICGLVTIIIHGMLDSVTWGTVSSIIFWFLFALAFALGVRSQESEPDL